ncbi:uncharacterized protein TRAVEDRAFT_70389 [Trametes versicolor FP-101664 SS1]|uniref:uncharacterized protein n=1 Tax=Trametes versicolor (strain FP-101664) TaxID=717944 RepID=UPI0004624262|nr:uncharacterized protein TRAVEDRAFT_70389 [Trametes versicolor FP-101664 SS1]EIW62239.1 hypothetical protein TRAVEDRAFT_70389 [Trametes versicolor FP-101664 SS1]
MDYNNAWLQPQPIPDLQTASVHDERSVGSNDWKDTVASVQGGGLNDLLPLGDIQGHHTPTPPLSSSNNYPLFLSTSPSYQYSNQWIPPPPQLPLSSYSSLNGATSTSSHSQQHSQSQNQGQGLSQPQGSSPMVIDPSLTTMNGSSSSPPQQYQQPAYLSHQNHPRMQYQYSMTSMNSPFVLSGPSHYQQQTQQQQQHAMQLPRHSHSPPQPQQQGTLSPFVLHSPNSGYYGGISPSSFYGQVAQPVAGPSSATSSASPAPSHSAPAPTPPPAPPANKVSPEQRRATLIADVKPLIQSNSFTGGGAVSQLVNILDDFGMDVVDPQVRLDVLTKIRDNAGNHYFRAWVDNPTAMEIVREWLKLAFVGRDDQQMVETIMPLLQIIDRLPFTVEKLKDSKLGKLIMKLIKDSPTPAIKDMAANLESKWRRMLMQQVPGKAESEDGEDTKGKKRRADSLSKSAPPVKKAAIPVAGSSTPKAVAVKKEAKPVVKDAKSDSSFFSKPKVTKKELPNFKKGPPSAPTATAPPKKAPESNIAQPSSVNGFQEVLKSWASSAGPSTPTPPPAAPGPSTAPAAGPSGAPGGPSLGKRKKSVTWAPDAQLEQIKLIDRAVYDDDGATGSLQTHNLRDLDRDEGAALHNHLFEEQMEWTELQPLEMPPEIDFPPRGSQSQERDAQEEREQTALVASYASPAQIPDSPAEPPAQMPEEQVDEGVRLMLTGTDVDAIFWSDGAPALVDTLHPSTSVADLVGQLAAAAPAFAPDVTMGDAPSMLSATAFNPEQLQLLVQQAQALSQNGLLSGLGGPPPPTAPPGVGVDQGGWGSQQYTDFDRGYHESNGLGRGAAEPNRRWGEDGWNDRNGPRGRGRGGPPMRGRGRGGGGNGDGFRNTKRKPCSFFQAGRCRYGDQCDFSHEPLNYN